MSLLDYTSGPVAMAAPGLVKAMTASGSFAAAMELEKIRQSQQRIDMEESQQALTIQNSQITTALKQQAEMRQFQDRLRQEQNDYTMKGGRLVQEGDKLPRGERVVYLADGRAMAVPDPKADEDERRQTDEVNHLEAVDAQILKDPTQPLPAGRIAFKGIDGSLYSIRDPQTEKDWDTLQGMMASQLNASTRVIDAANQQIPVQAMRQADWQAKLSEAQAEAEKQQALVAKNPKNSTAAGRLDDARAQMELAQSAMKTTQSAIDSHEKRMEEATKFIEQARGIMNDRFKGRPMRDDLYDMLYPSTDATEPATAAAPAGQMTTPAQTAGQAPPPPKAEHDFQAPRDYKNGLSVKPFPDGKGTLEFFVKDKVGPVSVAKLTPSQYPQVAEKVLNLALTKVPGLTPDQARVVLMRQVFSPVEISILEQYGQMQNYLAALLAVAGGTTAEKADGEVILEELTRLYLKRREGATPTAPAPPTP